MKNKIRLDTLNDVKDFVKIATSIESRVIITDDSGMRVNGKSLMGVIYALEFENLWCECDEDIYTKIRKYIVL